MKIIECPRDAMQGINQFIPTDKKVKYLNQLLEVGFDTIDFGSFVSPKAIPQMRDTELVLSQLDLTNTKSKLLAIIANTRGANEASKHDEIHYLGFPFSISETFQQRNTNKSIEQALYELQEIQNTCIKSSKSLVVYISMGFGNPYGDSYSEEIVEKYVDVLINYGIKIISLADTIGVSNRENIISLFTSLIEKYPKVEFGSHLHSTPSSSVEKIEAAYEAGCHRFDGAINGLGGCPMAKDELVGNLATEVILSYLKNKGEKVLIDEDAFEKSMQLAYEIFPS
ncbi:MAG: hydroxymethylglutaryl-CoA lyase [Cyclobacteriaceae bacterium]|nr:hydroxymethylglutaryl-CoA lyase [Cyclobacteriaceae bacterium]